MGCKFSRANTSALSFALGIPASLVRANTLHQGYTANRNRTLSHLYTNNIPNNVFLAGDSHANWVSDLAWLGEKPYDQKTGSGAIGVEFAGTAVSSSGYGGESIANGNEKAAGLVKDNPELQWTEGHYRGYCELHITPQSIRAQYFGMCCIVRKVRLFQILMHVQDVQQLRRVIPSRLVLLISL
jgi:phosphodiesterase/alkaline phosphatase D-like protein